MALQHPVGDREASQLDGPGAVASLAQQLPGGEGREPPCAGAVALDRGQRLRAVLLDGQPVHEPRHPGQRDQGLALVGQGLGQRGRRRPGQPGGLARRAGEDGGAGEHDGAVGLHRRVLDQVVRRPEVLERVHAAGQRLQPAELHQQPRQLVVGGRLGQRAPQVRRRRLGGTALHLAACGRPQHRDDGAVAARRHQLQVGGDLLRAGPRVGEHLRGAGVLQLALAQRQVVVHRGLDERVHEPQRQVGPQHLRPRQRRHGRRGDLVGMTGHRGGHRQRRAVAEHGDRPRDVPAGPGHPAQPHHHHARHRTAADGAHRVGVRGVRADSLGLEGAQQLAQQQRVAGGGAEAGTDEGVVGPLEPLADHRGGALGAEGRGVHGEHVGVRGHLVHQVLVGGLLPGAVVETTSTGTPSSRSGEVAQEPQRAGVAPLHVVDRDHQRTVGRRGCWSASRDRAAA